MINNSSLQVWNRLQQKSLNIQFTNEIIKGMNCSQFEANAILDTVHEVFGSYFQSNGCIKPGQTQISVVHTDNSPKLPLSACKQVNVVLTLYSDDDIDIRKQYGVVGLRQYKIERMAIEAFQQGGLLTVEDLAYRLINCGVRTICRDIKALLVKGIVLPLRSTIKDMGRTITHRKVIVEKWLKGLEYSEISRSTNHSTKSVKNYVNKFKQIISLTEENYDVHTIAFLTQVSASLVEEYYDIYNTSDIIEIRKSELSEYLKKNFNECNNGQ